MLLRSGYHVINSVGTTLQRLVSPTKSPRPAPPDSQPQAPDTPPSIFSDKADILADLGPEDQRLVKVLAAAFGNTTQPYVFPEDMRLPLKATITLETYTDPHRLLIRLLKRLPKGLTEEACLTSLSTVFIGANLETGSMTSTAPRSRSSLTPSSATSPSPSTSRPCRYN